MTAERWRQITAIFHAALAQDAAERDAFVASSCRHDEALRREVKSMLAAHEAAGGFGETPVARDARAFDPASSMSGVGFAAGTRLGPYEVVSLLGAGGMGVVYRARDTTLHRDVALKVLLPAVAHDPDRLARFTREARLLASLNHPHIAQVHGFEEANGVRVLVMELVEGPTLADRIARGPIPVEDALRIIGQIAAALEGAHDQGIVHRDLKPANVKLRPDGTVKVLDFGLAKAFDRSLDNGGQSATISEPGMTVPGVILGTAAYMAPEQARGEPPDRRADMWALGCVLFEMLTARRAFAGDTPSDMLVAIIEHDPEWQSLPAATPAPIRKLLQRCLEKHPRQRLDSATAARLEFEEALASPPRDALSARSPRRVVPVALAFGLGATLGAAVGLWTSTRTTPRDAPRPARFEVVPSAVQNWEWSFGNHDLRISPDGQHIAYVAGQSHQLVVRALDRVEDHPLPGTTGVRAPFFSPDSRWIGFFDKDGLKKVSVAGGPSTTIWRSEVDPRGASWGDDGNIVFSTRGSGELLRVPAAGGEPTVVTARSPDGNDWWPAVLPGGRGVLFTIAAWNQPGSVQVAVLDLKTGRRKVLMRGFQPEYVRSGHLIYAEAGALRAVRFDLARLEAVGDPVTVVDDLHMNPSAHYAASQSGTLVYLSSAAAGAETPRTLVWVDRSGRETAIKAPPRVYSEAILSPDGTKVALSLRDEQDDIHILDLRSGNLMQLTFGPAVDAHPVWTSDGKRIVYSSGSTLAFNLHARSADGTGTVERLTTSANAQVPYFVAPDRTGILGSDTSPGTAADIVWFALKSPDHPSGQGATSGSHSLPVQRLVHTRASEFNAALSPDGRYIAYQSTETGTNEIYVRPFPRLDDGIWRVSTNGGTRPVWARHGRELFYLDAANTLTAVQVETSSGKFVHGNQAKVFDAVYARPLDNFRTYDVSADGQRFLMIKEQAGAPSPRAGITVVLDWLDELTAKVP